MIGPEFPNVNHASNATNQKIGPNPEVSVYLQSIVIDLSIAGMYIQSERDLSIAGMYIQPQIASTTYVISPDQLMHWNKHKRSRSLHLLEHHMITYVEQSDVIVSTR